MKASADVNPESRSWLASRWERMSSGLKMFLIMSLGLLPLGLVAVAASVYSATENSEQRAEQTLARLDIKAQRLNELLARTSGTVRAAAAAIGAAPGALPRPRSTRPGNKPSSAPNCSAMTKGL